MEPIRCSLRDSSKRQAANGGAWFYDFRFQAVPQNKLETPNEQEAAYGFKVELEVTDSLMACGKWPTTSSDEKELQFFQYVKEELQKREPPGRDETIPLKLGSFTDNPSGKKGRFESGPIYSTQYIDRRQPFIIATQRRIGF